MGAANDARDARSIGTNAMIRMGHHPDGRLDNIQIIEQVAMNIAM